MKSFESISHYSFPTQIFFGAGVKAQIGQNLKTAGCSKPLIITDQAIANLPFFSSFIKDLAQAGLSVPNFTGISGNPVESQVIQGLEAYRRHGCDSAIGIGGGAVIDVTRAILLLVNHHSRLFDYEDGKADGLPIDQPIPYYIAVPTTAGTGSEVGRSAVISDDQSKAKKIIFSPSLLPKAVFADPELTLGLPAHITAATGMDALTHCIEAYLARSFHPICDGIALEGIRLINQSLEKCVRYASSNANQTKKDPEHLYHRGIMLNAAMMGAIAFQKGLGVNHSCAHSLSTVNDLHHGLANGIMLPYTMKFNGDQEKEKFAILAQTIGLSFNILDTIADEFVAWIVQFKKNLGIAEKLSEVGVNKDSLDKLVTFAFRDGCHQLNPRKVSKQDLQNIFSNAL